MTGAVWVSNALGDTTLTKWVSVDVKLANARLGENNAHRHVAGQTLQVAEMPKRIFADKKHGKLKSLPDFCNCHGFRCVSKRAADVLRGFDLGEGGLFPVEIYQPDQVTVFDMGYHFLNFGSMKQAFLPGQSIGARDEKPLKYWRLPPVMADDLTAVSSASLQGADLWTDPLLVNAFFVSHQLAEALKKAKLVRSFRLYRCRVE